MDHEYDIIIVAFIGSLPALLGVLLSIRKTQKVESKVDTLTFQTNHRMDELLELTKKSSHAEGMKDEKAEETARRVG